MDKNIEILSNEKKKNIIKISDLLSDNVKPVEYLCQRYNISLLQKDLDTLSPKSWLNDQIINFQVQFFNEMNKIIQPNKKSQNYLIFDSLFVQLLKKFNKSSQDLIKSYHNKVVKNLQNPTKGSLFTIFERMFFIVNEGNSHWILVEISKNTNSFDIIVYDSAILIMNRIQLLNKQCSLNFNEYISLDRDKAKSLPELFQSFKCLDVLTSYIIQDIEIFQEDEEKIDLEKLEFNYQYQMVPQQNNQNDCGVFTCFFAFKCFVQGLKREQLLQMYDQYIDLKKNREIINSLALDLKNISQQQDITEILKKYYEIFSKI